MAIGESAGPLGVSQLASIVDMNRILVIGPSGSGKSTLSTTLGKKLYRQQTKPDMADGCPEKLDLEFITWVMGYSSKTRPKVLKLIDENELTKQIVWLRSRKEVTKFLQTPA